MYKHKEIEKKWQEIWEQTKAFATTDNHEKKFYALDMFPYPSAAGLHVGHPEGYTATDIVARYKRLNGFDVLHPIGWDAFGLPAEQYALKTGNHPASFTQENIKTFKKQLKSLGISFDWDKEIDTTDPKYYQWTQWIFKKLYEHDLAEIKEIDVNWCQELGTVLANEEVITDENGIRVSERGNFPVVRKPMRQWVLKITAYAEKLLEGLNEVDFSESLKSLQENWIGKSLGHVVKFQIENSDQFIEVFTTRLDTIFGASFLVLAPEHSLINQVKNNKEVSEFLEYAKTISDRDRIANQKEKVGVYTNLNVIHPITKEVLPVWTSNYVLNTYGTGAIMAVPQEDERDHEFALKYNLAIFSIIPNKDYGLENSNFSNLDKAQITKIIYEFLAKQNKVQSHISYKLRDWIFSRQRYWGEPFPVYFDQNNNIYLDQKIVELPYMENIKPSLTGESPLANNKNWLYFEKDGKKYRRETNTMPQWAGSSWYFLAYILKNADGTYLDIQSQEAYQRFQKWLPVDLYIGGQEHAVGHLIYSRFWHKFLYDLKIVPVSEPFLKVVNQGMILGPDGQKMSKSRGNVINPDEIVNNYGADTLRVYEMFMGPLTDTKEWSESSIKGIRKWLDRVEVIISKFALDKTLIDPSYQDKDFNSIWQITIKEVTEAIEQLKFNIAISKLMVFINALYKVRKLNNLKPLVDFLTMLSTLAPHLSEELLEKLNQKQIKDQVWPTFDQSLLKIEAVKVVVQVNGKVRAIIEKDINMDQDRLWELAQNHPNVQKFIAGKEIKHKEFIKGKIIIFNI